MRKLFSILAVSGLLIGIIPHANGQSFVLADEKNAASIFVDPREPGYVQLAVEDLISDVRKITGKQLSVVNDVARCSKGCVIVATAANLQSHDIAGLGSEQWLSALDGKWEAYAIKTIKPKSSKASHLVITGGNFRGTMFGVYKFIQHYLEVDPLSFWSGLEPGKRNRLEWTNIEFVQQEPAFKFRGWFINDEDLLTEFYDSGAKRDINYPYYSQVVDRNLFAQVAEACVRSGFNLIIPASFIDILNQPEKALVDESSRRGLFISQHHVEPVGVSAFSFFNYWKKRNQHPRFSFYSNRKELEEVWNVYAAEWAKYPDVIWQIGLRGIADRPMWLADESIPQSDADRGALISEAMRVQMDIIKKVSKSQDVMVTSTLWAEGAGLHQDGHLKFPGETIIVFSDNSPGWKWQQDFYQIKRDTSKKYGVYYHHQLWGSGPHLAQAIPPGQTQRMFEDAAANKSDHFAIMNVSNVREFVLGIETSSELLWNLRSRANRDLLAWWVQKKFPAQQREVLAAYTAYFESFPLHPQTKSPFTLDGQLRSYGNGILNQLRFQLSDPIKFQQEEERSKTRRTEEQIWGKRFLSDMHPESEVPPTEYAPVIHAQLEKLQGMEKSLKGMVSGMPDPEKTFFTNNFLSQRQIMIGLLAWCGHVIDAQQGVRAGDFPGAESALALALDALTQVQQAKALASAAPWENWYRGDKKMNIAAMAELTTSVKAAIQQARNRRN